MADDSETKKENLNNVIVRNLMNYNPYLEKFPPMRFYETSNKIKSNFRDFKIQFLEGRKLELNEKNYKEFINSKRYKTYVEFTNNEIITGSNVLSLFGLIEREPKDMDLIVPESHSKKWEGMRMDLSYNESQNPFFQSMIGTKYFKYKYGFFKQRVIRFDFFKKEEDVDFITVEGLKLDNPFNVINKKIKISEFLGFRQGEKHFEDVKEILKII